MITILSHLKDRLARLNHELFHFEHCDLADKPKLESLFEKYHFDRVIHLAAQLVFDIVSREP